MLPSNRKIASSNDAIAGHTRTVSLPRNSFPQKKKKSQSIAHALSPRAARRLHAAERTTACTTCPAVAARSHQQDVVCPIPRTLGALQSSFPLPGFHR